MDKVKQVGWRMRESFIRRLKHAAIDEYRSPSQLVVKVMTEWLDRKGGKYDN